MPTTPAPMTIVCMMLRERGAARGTAPGDGDSGGPGRRFETGRGALGATQQAAGAGAGGHAMRFHQLAVDQHRLDAGGRLQRFGEGRCV